jgi:hypothetical protein
MSRRASGVASTLGYLFQAPKSTSDRAVASRAACDEPVNDAAGSELCVIPMVPPRTVPFAVGMMLAPLVRQCDVPFRRLCVSFGADVVYTQMLMAHTVADDARENGLRKILGSHFSPLGDGVPLIAQIAGDNPETMSKAARALAPHCAAVDINLGCPQEAARDFHFGGFLCK